MERERHNLAAATALARSKNRRFIGESTLGSVSSPFRMRRRVHGLVGIARDITPKLSFSNFQQ
jgi:hypothetical protein